MTRYIIYMNHLNITSQVVKIAIYDDSKIAEDLAYALNEGQEHLEQENKKYFTVFKEEA